MIEMILPCHFSWLVWLVLVEGFVDLAVFSSSGRSGRGCLIHLSTNFLLLPRIDQVLITDLSARVVSLQHADGWMIK